MQVFKAFLKTALKYAPTIALYFIIFVIISLAQTYAMTSKESSSFRTVALHIGVVDEDGTAASHALTDYLGTMHQITPTDYDEDQLLDRLFYRDLDYVVILPAGFEEKLLAGEDDLFEAILIPGVYSTAFVEEQVNTYLNTLRLYLLNDASLADAIDHTDLALANASNQVQILNSGKDVTDTPAMTGLYYYYHFLPYVIFSSILLGITPVLSSFWQADIAKRISCSSLSLLRKNVQLTLGSIVYCMAIWLLFILTAGIFYGEAFFSKQGLLCAANSFYLVPLGIGFALIVSAFTPTSNIINMINNILSLSMCFLCGVFVPQQMLGENVLAVGKYLPFYWYIKNNDLIFSFSGDSFSFVTYRKHLLIELLFVVAVFAIALVTSKYKKPAA